MNSKRKSPHRRTDRRKARQRNNSRYKYNKSSKQHKAFKIKVKSVDLYELPKEDRDWFKAHQGRKFRIRPERHDEPNIGYLILERLSYGSCLGVNIGPVGAMLTDSDETLSKVYRYLRCKKEGMIFPHDGTLAAWGE